MSLFEVQKMWLPYDYANPLSGSKVLWEVSQAVAIVWMNCASLSPSFPEAK